MELPASFERYVKAGAALVWAVIIAIGVPTILGIVQRWALQDFRNVKAIETAFSVGNLIALGAGFVIGAIFEEVFIERRGAAATKDDEQQGS